MAYLAVWSDRWGVDLQVYREGTLALFHGHDPYRAVFTADHLPYTYPPPALILLAPLSALPLWPTRLLWWVAGVVTVLISTWMIGCRARPAGGVRLGWLIVLVGFASVACEPLRSTLDYGQVNSVLMMLVLTDLLVARRLRGVGIGLAAAVKLTPLIFVVLLVLERDLRALCRLVLTLLLSVGVVWLLFPGPSSDFWLHQFTQFDRPGNFAFAGNQSLTGLLHRLGASGPLATLLWAVLASVVLMTVAFIVSRCLQRGARLMAVFAVALGGLLISPISWSHHWLWVCVVPVLGMGGDFERLGWPSAVTRLPWLLVGVAVIAPYWWNLEGVFGLLTRNALVFGGIVVVVGWGIAAARLSSRGTHRQLTPGRACASRTARPTRFRETLAMQPGSGPTAAMLDARRWLLQSEVGYCNDPVLASSGLLMLSHIEVVTPQGHPAVGDLENPGGRRHDPLAADV